jgi:hypothetical protein
MDEEIKETVEDVQNENMDVNEQDSKQESEADSKETVISKIKDKISNYFNGDNEEQETEVELPAGFAEAVKKLGWTDEETTEFTKDYSTKDLEEMLPFLIGEDSDELEETSEQDDEKDKEVPDKKTDKKEDKDSQDDEQIQKLLDRIKALEEAQGKSKEAEKEQEVVNLANRASVMFDEASKDFEIFGKTEDLPKFPGGQIIPSSPQMKARSEVWETAWLLKAGGMDFDKAMSVSLNAFKGKNLAKDIHRKVVKDLKSKERRLGGKRITHETKMETLSGPDVIRQIARKHGKEIL